MLAILLCVVLLPYILCWKPMGQGFTASTKICISMKSLRLYATAVDSADSIQSLLPMKGKVACVTGATRGIGRGIALGLAEQGATIYITGRSIDDSSITEPQLGGTLADVLQEITALGGVGVPVKVDHADDSQVEALFRTIEEREGRLDLLVNNAFQVPSPPDGSQDPDLLFRNFWEQPGWFWDQFINVGLRSHYVASCLAYPLMRKTETTFYSSSSGSSSRGSSSRSDSNDNSSSDSSDSNGNSGSTALHTRSSCSSCSNSRPLIAHVSSFGGATYSFNVAYGVGKAGVDRLAKDLQVELYRSNSNIRSVSLYPGIVRTERMSGFLDSGEWEKRSTFATPDRFVESPILSGRALAALFLNSDGFLDTAAGGVCVVAELAKRYRITDPVSGITPPSIRSLKFLIPSIVLSKLNKASARQQQQQLEDLIIALSPDVLLPMAVMGMQPPPRAQ